MVDVKQHNRSLPKNRIGQKVVLPKELGEKRSKIVTVIRINRNNIATHVKDSTGKIISLL